MKSFSAISQQLRSGDHKLLARCISMVENESEGWMDLLQSLDVTPVPVIGITGPPGAGKSTLISNLVQHYSKDGKKIAVLAVDPSSPFHHGSLLGDRLRMSLHFSNPGVYIRSVAARGSLGGLTDKAMEITDVMKAADFDLVIIEKAYRLIARERMKDINKSALAEQLQQKINEKGFNLYKFVKSIVS